MREVREAEVMTGGDRLTSTSRDVHCHTDLGKTEATLPAVSIKDKATGCSGARPII